MSISEKSEFCVHCTDIRKLSDSCSTRKEYMTKVFIHINKKFNSKIMKKGIEEVAGPIEKYTGYTLCSALYINLHNEYQEISLNSPRVLRKGITILTTLYSCEHQNKILLDTLNIFLKRNELGFLSDCLLNPFKIKIEDTHCRTVSKCQTSQCHVWDFKNLGFLKSKPVLGWRADYLWTVQLHRLSNRG